MILNKTSETEKNTEQLKETIDQKIQKAEQQLASVTTKIKQSQVEVDKLAQKNISYSAKIRNIKENTVDIPSASIRDTYDGALDSQQRLFVMRGQMEKLKGEQVHLQDFIMQMQDMNEFLTRTPLLEGGETELNAADLIESGIQAQEAEKTVMGPTD